MTTKLKEITFLTIKNLKNNEIILPGDYLKVFDQIAKELKFNTYLNFVADHDFILRAYNNYSFFYTNFAIANYLENKIDNI